MWRVTKDDVDYVSSRTRLGAIRKMVNKLLTNNLTTLVNSDDSFAVNLFGNITDDIIVIISNAFDEDNLYTTKKEYEFILINDESDSDND